MKSRIKKISFQILGIAIAAIILYFVVVKFGKYWTEISGELASANWLLMLCGIFLTGIGVASITFIWQMIMRTMYGVNVPFYRGLTMIFLPNIARYIPGKIWFIFGIIYFAKKWSLDVAAAFTASLMAHIIFLMVGTIFGLIIVGSSSFTIIPIWILLPVLLVLAFFVLRPAIIHKLLAFTLKFTGKESHAKTPPPMKANVIVFGAFVAIIMWLLMGLGIMLCMQSVFPQFSWNNYFSVTGAFSFSYIISYLTIITPAGLGIREGVMLYTLPTSISEAHRAFLAIGSRVWMMLSEIILLALIVAILFLKGEIRKNPDCEPSVCKENTDGR